MGITFDMVFENDKFLFLESETLIFWYTFSKRKDHHIIQLE